jgi:hypothetical protein
MYLINIKRKLCKYVIKNNSIAKIVKYAFRSENGEICNNMQLTFCISIRYDLKQMYILLRLLYNHY